MKKVYIAHPYIGDGSEEWGDTRTNMNRYLRICAWASEQGVAVVSWAHHHLLHASGLTNGDADYYLTRDERLIDGCDELWVAGPPHVSAGVRREILYATKTGVTTRYVVAEGVLSAWNRPEWPPGPDCFPGVK